MAQVSIAQVDNLSDAVLALSQAYSVAQDNYGNKVRELSELYEATEAELNDAIQSVEEVDGKVEEFSQQLQELNEQLQAAQSALSKAQCALEDAQAALESCESSGSYNEDGNYNPPDCSCEKSDVANAREDVANSQQQVVELEKQIEEKQKKYEEAQNLLQKCRERAKQAKANYMKCKNMCENYITTGAQMLNAFQGYVNLGIAHLNNAKQALEQYLATNPTAASFEKWIHWQPQNGQVISPKDIHDRLTLSPSQQKLFSEYLYERDSSYRNLINTARERYNSANGAAEKQKVLIQASRNLSGELAEKIVAYAFKPMGNVSTQGRTYFDDGKYTKTDIIVTDLKNVTILGKGEGRFAPMGGSIAIEVKTGQASYIASQKDHMIFQAGGHQNSSASVVICSRDIKDLPPDKEKEVREALAGAGSPIFGTLPRKQELDQTIWQTIIGTPEMTVNSQREMQ